MPGQVIVGWAMYCSAAGPAIGPRASNESQQQSVDLSGSPRLVKLHESTACKDAPPPCPP